MTDTHSTNPNSPTALPTTQLDDEMARITRWDFSPGASTGRHKHQWPYFVVMLTEGTLRINDGCTDKETQLSAGQSYRRPSGIEHDVINASPHAIAFVEIELKEPFA